MSPWRDGLSSSSEIGAVLIADFRVFLDAVLSRDGHGMSRRQRGHRPEGCNVS